MSAFDNPAINLQQALTEFVSANNASPIPVNERNVLGIPTVFRGVKLISSIVSRIPRAIYKRANGLNLIDENHPANWLLQRPSRHIGRYTLFSVLVQRALLQGNGYALITKEGDTPVALTLLDNCVTYPVVAQGELAYKTELADKKYILPPDQIFHVRNMSDGICGHSCIELMAESLGHSLSLIRYGAVFFKNFSSVGNVISIPNYIKDEEELAKFRAGFAAFHRGVNSADFHGLAILQGGATLQRLTLDNESVEFLASREFDITTIANALGGVPPHLLGAKINASYNSLEQQNQAFLQTVIEDWLATISEEVEMKLLTEYQKSNSTHYCDHERAYLVKTDIAGQHQLDLNELNNGCITLNTWLARHNFPRVNEPFADWHRMPVQLGYSEQMQVAKPTDPNPVDTTAEAAAEDIADGPEPASDFEPADTPLNDERSKLQKLFTKEVTRLNERLKKAIDSSVRKQEEIDLDKHVSIFAEAISPVVDNAETITRLYFRDVLQDWKLLDDSSYFVRTYGRI